MDQPVTPVPSASTHSGGEGELQHVTQEMYKKNLELNERNKTLLLLRKIDEIVLNSKASSAQVATQIAATVTKDTDFDLMLLMLVDKKRRYLEGTAMAYGGGDNKVPDELTQSIVSTKLDLKTLPKVVTQAIESKQSVISTELGELFKSKLDRNIISSLHELLQLKTIFTTALVARQEVMGIMVIGSRLDLVAISEFQKNLIERLAGVVGIAIDSKLLHEEIQAATAQLTIQNQRLKELDQAKDEFISMASHQLRTPLTSIKGYLSMLLEGDAGNLNVKQRDFADASYTSTQRVISLISDMLNVSRINTGKLVIERAPVDLDAVVKDELKQLERTAMGRNVKLEYESPVAKLPLLNLDEGKTRQVIMNFVDNAIYYAPNTTVEVALSLSEGRVRFTVKDHGIGVPVAAQQHLFSKFFRADNAKKARPDGTGLGLFMAKMVIEMQGGVVVFSSQEGKGSTFGFEFPLSAVQVGGANTKVSTAAAKQPATVI